MIVQFLNNYIDGLWACRLIPNSAMLKKMTARDY
jgi:hypothetical protein